MHKSEATRSQRRRPVRGGRARGELHRRRQAARHSSLHREPTHRAARVSARHAACSSGRRAGFTSPTWVARTSCMPNARSTSSARERSRCERFTRRRTAACAITAPVGLGPMLTRVLATYLIATPDVTIELDLTERRVDLLAEGFDIAVRTGRDRQRGLRRPKDLRVDPSSLFASKAYLARRGRPAARRRPSVARPHRDALVGERRGVGAVQRWEAPSARRVQAAPRGERAAGRTARGARRHRDRALTDAHLEISELVRVLPRLTAGKGGLWVLYPSRRSLTAAVRSCVDHLLRGLPSLAPH